MLRDILHGALGLSIAAAAWHHVGYPILAVIWTRLLPRPLAPRLGPDPRVTVLTAAYDEAAVIAAKIENLLALDYPKLEIVLISDGSTDGTADVMAACKDPRVRCVILPDRQGKAVALRAGAATASGDVLVISDANTRIAADAIGRLVAAFRDPAVGLVSGDVAVDTTSEAASGIVGRAEGLYWRYEAMIRRAESAAGSTVTTVGAIMAVRRVLFTLEAETINDDAALALATIRRGYRVVFAPDVVAFRRPSRTMADERRRRVRIAAGRYQLLSDPNAWPWRRPQALIALISHKALRLLMPIAMGIALATNIVLVGMPGAGPVVIGLLLLQGIFYALAAGGALLEGRRLRWRPATVAWYLTAGHLSSLIGLFRHLRRSQSVLWEKAAR